MSTPYFFLCTRFLFFSTFIYTFSNETILFVSIQPFECRLHSIPKTNAKLPRATFKKNAHILHGNQKLRASIKVSFINYNAKSLRKCAPRMPQLYFIIILSLCIIYKTPNHTYITLYQPAGFLLSRKNTSSAPTVYAVGTL